MRALVALARPGQWLKNGFVFVGVLFGHAWMNGPVVADALLLFGAFCLMASGVYAFNDVMDREADRVHPDKRRRPIASGAVTARNAAVFAVLLVLGGLLAAERVSSAALAMAGAYIAINLAYSLGLKHVPVLDVFLIAAGFMVRILAGTSGLGIAPSRWLLLCGFMVTLFFGFAKRRAELAGVTESVRESEAAAVNATAAGEERPRPVAIAQRRSLNAYSLELLDGMIAVTAAGTMIGYAFYTIDPRTIELQATGNLIATVPFVMYGLVRYLWVLYRRGGGADPSAELLRDPHLVVALLGWLGLTWWLIA
jgi:4-hydroxybenzoate polyprenyltransferase